MIYIYDVLLNFNDIDKVYEFYEWNVDDAVDHIKRIPLIKVDTATIDDFVFGKVVVSTDLLDIIYHKTEIFNKRKIVREDYISLFTDGRVVIALEFNKDGLSLCKSRLLLDEETEIANLAKKMDLTNVEYNLVEKYKDNSYLTRSERGIKNYLVNEINNSYQNKNYDKLRYLYVECFGNKKNDIQEMYYSLINSMNSTLNENHFKIYNLLKLSCKKI
ncbi:MAG: DUF3603 family protein [Bacilli bacterium]|nr:DUF3603 family protein [Bacilli bacterium]